MRIPRRLRVVVLITLALFVFGKLGALAPLEQVVSWSAGFLEGFVAPLRTWQRERIDVQTAQTAIQGLQERISTLEQENTRLFSENDSLRQTLRNLSFLRENSLNGIPALVLGRSPETDNQIFILDRGASDTVTDGLPVVSGDGIFLGTIQETRSATSSMRLLTAATSAVGAEVQNASHSNGILQGEHGLSLLLTLLPIEDALEVGQRVVTSAIDADIPSGLLIGTITEIRKEDGGLFQTAVVNPATRYDRSRSVLILLPHE